MRPVAEGIHRQPLGKRVDNRRAYAVQTAGIGIVFVAELAARMQTRINQFHARYMQLRMLVHGHAAAVVPYRRRAVLMKRHQYFRGVAAQRLVNGVVDDLPQKMMQAAHAGGTDVHTRTHTYGVKAFEHLQFAGVIRRIGSFDLRHENPPGGNKLAFYYSTFRQFCQNGEERKENGTFLSQESTKEPIGHVDWMH